MLKLHFGRMIVARGFLVGALLAFQGPLISASYAQLSVTDSGSPSFTIPIAVPPGIAGMQPQLALTYTQGASGPLGFGWTMQGVSLITRCPATPATDGATPLDTTARAGIQNLPSDKLCIDGQRLIPTDATGTPTGPVDEARGVGAGVREYRTERDSFMRVRAYGNANGSDANGPAFFRAWTKAGQIIEYGNTADSSVEAQGTGIVQVWGANRISDTVGNYIDFAYEKRSVVSGTSPASGVTAGMEWNLVDVCYTGHLGGPAFICSTPHNSASPFNRVHFNYSDRAPGLIRTESYLAGTKSVGVRQLDSIQTFTNESAGEVAVRYYRINHGTSAASGRTLVTSVEDCRGNNPNVCLPAATFSYSGAAGDTYQEVPLNGLVGVRLMSLSTGGYGILTGDFDGDGKTDVIRWSDTPSENALFFSRPTASGSLSAPDSYSFAQSAQFNITDDNLGHSTGCYSAIVADFNGDGLADILRYSAPGKAPDGIHDCNIPGPSYIYFSRGDGTFQKQPVTDAAGNPLNLTRVRTITSSQNFRPTPIQPVDDGDVSNNPQITAGANFYVGDFNGDGRLDIVVGQSEFKPRGWTGNFQDCQNQCTFVYQGLGDGRFQLIPLQPPGVGPQLEYTSLYSDPLAKPEQQKFFVDVDGDGLQDLFQISSAAYYRSNGKGGFSLVQPADSSTAMCYYSSQIGDVNGDGKIDRICAGGAPGANGVAISTGNGNVFFASQFNLHAADQDMAPTPTATSTTVGFMAIDINGDGRTDIIRWKDDTTQNRLYLSNGDGTFTESPAFNTSMANVQLRNSTGNYDFLIADFAGRGNVDILRISDDPNQNKLYVRANQAPLDLLTGVTSGLGSTSTVDYLSLAQDNGVYVSNRPLGVDPIASSTYPKMSLRTPMYVVGSLHQDAGGNNPPVDTAFQFSDLAIDWSGRGLLGFAESKRTAPGPNGELLTSISDVRQDFPFIGAATTVRQRLGSLINTDGMELSRTVTSYCDQMPTVPPNCTSGRVRQPFVYQTATGGADLGGIALPNVVTTNTYDSFGNALTIAVQTVGSVGGISQAFTKATTSQFTNNTAGDAWLLGRLTRSSVTNGVPDDVLPTAGYNGTTAFTPPPPPPSPPVPISPAVLSVILDYLLND